MKEESPIEHLKVLRHGHVNHFTPDYAATMRVLTEGLGGRAFWEWVNPEVGSANSLVLVGPLCVELFAPRDPEGPIGRWLARYPAGWHSLEWTVPDLPEAAAVLEEAGVRITERTDDYFFTHPKDLGGLSLEVSHHLFDGDPRDAGDWDLARGLAGTLPFAGPPRILVAAPDPAASARRLAALTGAPVEEVDRSGIGGAGSAVVLPDHYVEYVGPLPGAGGAVGRRLEARSPGIWAVELPVGDLAAAGAALPEALRAGVRDTGSALWLSPEANHGAVFVLAGPRG